MLTLCHPSLVAHSSSGHMFVFPYCIEAGAVFLRVQVPVSHDEGMGEDPLQFAQQGKHRPFLWEGPRVGGFSVAGQSAFVADAYGVPVVVAAVRPHLFQRASRMYGPVPRDIEVVSDVPESAVPDVVVSAGLKIQAPPLGGGRAVDDYQGDAPHASPVFNFRRR